MNRLCSHALRVFLVTSLLLVSSGCASRNAGIQKTIKDIASIERITSRKNLMVLRLDRYEGVGMLSLGKVGAFGAGLMGWSGSVYVKDEATGQFGPPSFVRANGLSVGLVYIGINAVDCVLLFKHREDAIEFAKRGFNFNFSNEASFLVWGRKQFTGMHAKKYSDGGGLALGAVEAEFLVGGPRKGLHEKMYKEDITVDEILVGDVEIPEELKESLAQLNGFMMK